jgi:hypothetical protein
MDPLSLVHAAETWSRSASGSDSTEPTPQRVFMDRWRVWQEQATDATEARARRSVFSAIELYARREDFAETAHSLYMSEHFAHVRSFPSLLGQFRALTHLQLHNFEEVEEFPDCFDQLAELRAVSLQKWRKLQSLPPSLTTLRKLNYLWVTETAIRRLPEGMAGLRSLMELDLSENPELVELSEEVTHLPELQSLSLAGCLKLRALPESLGRLSNLIRLSLFQCQALENIPQSILECRGLRILDIVLCTGLQALDPRMLFSFPHGRVAHDGLNRRPPIQSLNSRAVAVDPHGSASAIDIVFARISKRTRLRPEENDIARREIARYMAERAAMRSLREHQALSSAVEIVMQATERALDQQGANAEPVSAVLALQRMVLDVVLENLRLQGRKQRRRLQELDARGVDHRLSVDAQSYASRIDAQPRTDGTGRFEYHGARSEGRFQTMNEWWPHDDS